MYKLKVLDKYPKNEDSYFVVGIIKSKYRLKSHYIVASRYFHDGHNKIKVNKDEYIEPLLSKNLRRIFVSGETGSGKSTIIAKLIKNSNYRTLILSAKKRDPAYQDLKRTNYLDEKMLIEQPLKNLKDLKNKTIVFDDISYPNENVNKFFRQLRDRILSLGRQYNINTIVSEWVMKNATLTKYPLLQSQAIIFFPEFDKKHVIDYLIQRGFTRKYLVKTLKHLNSRWCLLIKNPPILISEHIVRILHQ